MRQLDDGPRERCFGELMVEWWIVAGVLVNSALYLSSVIAIGFSVDNALAWKLGIAAVGFAYISYWMQGMKLNRFAGGIVVLASQLLGIAAGIALLV